MANSFLSDIDGDDGGVREYSEFLLVNTPEGAVGVRIVGFDLQNQSRLVEWGTVNVELNHF